MPVLWEFLDDVLVLRYVGDPSTKERTDAVEEAIADPAFRPGMFLLFDTRSAIGTASTEELNRRVEWAVGLTARGFRPRYATVVDPERSGIVQSGVRMVAGRVEVGVFATMEEALAWLARPHPSS